MSKKKAAPDAGLAERLAAELGLAAAAVAAVMELLDGGASIPFIARYRKEATGSLDEVRITTIRDRLQALRDLDARRAAVIASLAERGLLTDELSAALAAAATLAEVEDIYLPYRPKRRTRAMIAREKGLAPLAELLLVQTPDLDPVAAAAGFVDAGKGVADADEALAGARDIIAETAAEDADTRGELRTMFMEQGVLTSKAVPGKEEAGAKFRDWFDWSEPLGRAPSHRVLALLRGEAEEALRVSVRPPEEEARVRAVARWARVDGGRAAEQVAMAAADGYQRLLAPSLENETRAWAKERADAEAIRVFAANVRELLLAAPLGQKTVLALDPGLRTGCKTVVLDPQGKLLRHDVLHIAQSTAQMENARAKLRELCDTYKVEAIAIGNGTGSREAEAFVRSAGLPAHVAVVVVSESGASVYSAMPVAREEFPDLDLTVRGAVSIGRRLMDPLAELVKLDPKSIGVGQYQHDVDQPALQRALDDTVASCVNAVGVEVNTASKRLLSYVSGLGPALAGNIVKYRDENGPFASRTALKKVPRLGPKAFEQAAGFLRIRGGDNPLDASAVHPERYDLVRQMAKDLDVDVKALLSSAEARAGIKPERYVDGDVGLPTLKDILSELAKPGRDPRERFEAFSFAEGVTKPADLQPGMKLPGIVTNVTNFGAFIDVGVHQDGLAHVSELADHFVKNPSDVVKVGQRVTATVMEVDLTRNRISLSLRSHPGGGRRRDAGATISHRPSTRHDPPVRWRHL